ncbi:MAG: tRNA lysidine(34) synthetase TilS, partial [Spirochaetia bacterium]|nr:tRNA lysidine(34) synthetase TilS [Spirochaetia bacterium]
MTHIPDTPTIETAALAVARHFPESLKGAVPILGVSGGRDSMLLMFVFARLFADKYIHEQPVVFHLDHRLRPDSGADAELVRRVSADMDLPLYLEAKDCAAFARRTGRGTKDAGRLLRYRCMERVGRQFQRFYAVTAHHADDYVESLLLHLCRGGGPGSLGTMGLVSRLQNMLVFRPFMPFTRDYISDVVAG